MSKNYEASVPSKSAKIKLKYNYKNTSFYHFQPKQVLNHMEFQRDFEKKYNNLIGFEKQMVKQ